MSYANERDKDFQEVSLPPELPPEIRFKPLDCSPEVIDQANATERRTDVCQFERTQAAIDRIRTLQSPSKSRLESWIWHPDERVPIALLTSSLVRSSTKLTRHIARHMAQRAIQEAQSRGEIWTPVLDALSSSIWAAASRITSPDKRFHEQHYLETVVEPWVKRQKDSTVLRDIVLQTRSPNLIRRIAGSTFVADENLLNAVLNKCPAAVIHLTENDHLPPKILELILDRITTASGLIEGCNSRDDYLLNTYARLTERGLCFRPDHIERLLGIFKDPVLQFDDHRVRVSNRAFTLLTQYVRDTGDEEVAFRMIEVAGKLGTPDWALHFFDASEQSASQLAITPRLARAALAHFGNFAKTLTAVAKHSEIRQDPDIRRQLLESRVPAVLFSLGRV